MSQDSTRFGLILMGWPTMMAGTVLGQVQFNGVGDLPLGVYASSASGVSGDGLVVAVVANDETGHRACRWTRSAGLEPLLMMNTGAPVSGFAQAVSRDGRVIVGMAAGNGAFRWTQGVGAQLLGPGPSPVPGGTAVGVSGDGTIAVGTSYAPNPVTGGTDQQVPTRWMADGAAQSLGWLPTARYGNAQAVSDDGRVVVGADFGGTAPGAIYGKAWIWDAVQGKRALGPFPPNAVGWGPTAVSADGSVVAGLLIDSNVKAFMFFYTDAWLQIIPQAAQVVNTYVRGMTPDAKLVVGEMNGGRSGAFCWTPEHGTELLVDVLDARYAFTVPAGWSLDKAWAVSADGTTIVGEGLNPSGNLEGWVVHLPTPLSCYANCDASSAPPVLNIADFVCFMSAFAAGSSLANCDHSTTPPVLNVADFVCFQSAFAAGCP